MNVKFVDKTKYAYKFLFKNSRIDIVNAIRRTITGRVKTYAIEKVLIYKNDSVMPDEFLAHRLGLVPIRVEDYEDDKEITLYLKKTGGLVKSGDIETNGVAEIPLKNIPIVKLNPNDSIELELILKKSNGMDHIKWSPATVYYRNLPEIKQKENIQSVEGLCPKNLLEIKAGKVVLKDMYACNICKYCEVASNGNLELNLKEDEFLLFIEPYGQLTIKEIIKETNKVIQDEFSELAKEIEKIK